VAVTSTALAESISCGQFMIEDDQTDPVTKNEVLKKCGEPTVERGNDWVYERYGQNTKILHFNDNGGLESISERVGD
jgi:hypothetical protein